MRTILFALSVLFLLSSCQKEYVYKVGNLPFFEFDKVALNNTESIDTTRSFFNGIINGVSTSYSNGESTNTAEGKLELLSAENKKRFRFVYKLTPLKQENYQEFPEIYLPSFLTNNLKDYIDSLVIGKNLRLTTPSDILQTSNTVALVMNVPYVIKGKNNSTDNGLQIFYSHTEKQRADSGVKVISKEYKKIGKAENVVDITLSVNCTLEDYQLNTFEIEDGLFKIRIFLK